MIEKVRFGESVSAVLQGMMEDGWNVLAVLTNVEHGGSLVIPGKNIVSNQGDKYYAQRAAGETATILFHSIGGLRMGSANTAPVKTATDVTTFLAGSGHTVAAGYPKTNDTDADNTGALVDAVTWFYSYTTAEGNVSGIQEGAIVDNITTPTQCVSHFLFAASFSKTSANTLKVFVNHTFNGV
jgi:hypothetical protein